MKLEIQAIKAAGLPNYGKASATIGITVDVPDAIGDDYEALRARLLTLQALARELVETDIAAQVGAPTSPAPVVSHSTTTPAASASALATPSPFTVASPSMSPVSTPEPDRELVVRGGDGDGRRYRGKQFGAPVYKTTQLRVPKSGRELYGWLKDRDSEYGTRLLNHVSQWAKLNQIEDLIIEWDGDAAKWGYDEAVRKLEEWKRKHPVAAGAVSS